MVRREDKGDDDEEEEKEEVWRTWTYGTTNNIKLVTQVTMLNAFCDLIDSSGTLMTCGKGQSIFGTSGTTNAKRATAK